MYNRHTLPWLLKAHDGIDNEIRSAQTIKDFKKLLKYSLDINQLRNLSSRIHNNDSHDRKVKVATSIGT